MAKRKSKSKRAKKSPSSSVTKRVRKSTPETPLGPRTIPSTPRPQTSARELMEVERPRNVPRPSAKKPAPAPEAPLTMAQIYEALAALLVPYARKLESEMHPKIGFCLKAKNPRTGRESHFGAVQALADGVAYHLFPLYGHPELLDGLQPEVFNRLRSKTHFHFEALDAGILAELSQLTHRAFECFVSEGMT